MSMIRFYLFMGFAFILAMSLISVAHSMAVSILIITFIVAIGHLVISKLKGQPNAPRPRSKDTSHNYFRPDDH